MNRKQLEKAINFPVRTYRSFGRVCVEAAYESNDSEMITKFPYAGRGKTIDEACADFIKIHEDLEISRLYRNLVESW